MARARNIKPGFFKNEDLAECTCWARLLFAGLWTLADREGRLEDRPKRIKGELFAYDSVEVAPLLEELESRGFIARYRVGSLGIIQVISFLKHQNPHHREPQSDLPPPQSPGLSGHASEPKPEASPGLDPPQSDLPPPQSRGEVDLARGSSRAESGALNPEHGSHATEPRAVAPPPPAAAPPPTLAGSVCRAMKTAGLQSVNPGDPRLLALLAQGATAEEFEGLASEAVGKGKGWGWVLAVLQARRADAAAITLTAKAKAADIFAGAD